MLKRLIGTTVFTAILLLCAGCGGEGNRVSGKVTFKGAPVPAGKIYFMPDGTKGNNAGTGFADIKDGLYDTSKSGGRGAPAGPVIIAIEGIDPSKPPPKADSDVIATVLFPRYELAADMPSSSSTKDIDVPESAAKGPPPAKKVGPEIVP
jgi:hypothetical protein